MAAFWTLLFKNMFNEHDHMDSGYSVYEEILLLWVALRLGVK